MPLVPLIFINPRIFRRLIDRLVGFWLVMPSGLMEFIFGVHLYVSGDAIEHSAPALIIMNHRTRLDWLFFWNALYRIDPWLLTSEKISLKGSRKAAIQLSKQQSEQESQDQAVLSVKMRHVAAARWTKSRTVKSKTVEASKIRGGILKYLPGGGWAMASNVFMFLDRSFASDKPRIDSLVEYYSKAGSNYQLLLFPEGTDKCPKATERSMKFAEKNNLIHYDYLLHPRTTGFAYILQKMRKVDYVEYVYDVTVAYNDAIVQSEVDLVTLGLCPKQVHFDIRKFSVKDLPETDSELDEWLKKLWAEKEERLRKFYTQTAVDRRLDTLPNAQIFEMTPLARLLQIFIILVWVVLTLCWMYFFFSYNYQGMVALVTIGFFVGAQYFYGGVEMIITEQAFKQWQVIKKEDKKNN